MSQIGISIFLSFYYKSKDKIFFVISKVLFHLIFIFMKQLIKKILKEETIKSSKDLYEIIILQDIINSDTRIIDKSAIQHLINKVVSIIRRCTSDKDGDYYYQVRTNEHEVFKSDIIVHRIIYVGEDVRRYKKCITEKVKLMIRKNHDKGEVKLITDITEADVKDLLKHFTKNSTHRATWSKDAFFDFYHEDMVELSTIPYIKIEL